MYNVLDLFAGIGGFSLGLERTGGFRTAAFCEIDKKAQLVLRKHWPNTPIFDDVTTLTKGLLDERGISIDVITGGFPCQDISLAGKGAGLEGERSGLWFQFHRLIEEIQPRYAIIENVSALRSRGLDVVLRGLAEIGYDAEWHCIPASAVGAPHRRDRIWIVAYPQSASRFDAAAEANPRTNGGQSGDGFECGSEAVAYTDNQRGWPQSSISGSDGGETWDQSSRGGATLANASGIRLSGQGQSIEPKHSTPLVNGQAIESFYGRIAGIWTTEPDVGRVANGVPNRVDRLKQLGNAVVPQIPQLIGEAILQAERVA